MAKKRNCRRTDQEREIHARAVALRKMPDWQLMKKYDDAYDDGYRNGYAVGKEHGFNKAPSVEYFIGKLERVPGFGPATIAKIRTALELTA